MANKMASFCLFLICSLINISSALDSLEPNTGDLTALELNPIHYPPLECYNSPLKIGKQTLATTDSYRDTEMLQLIFPEAKLEYIPHFNQDECARASKLYLPYTCFKLHSPQTWQLEEGYLSVKTLETEYTKKFYAVINGYSDHNFDAFFDNNIAFWVLYLDKYLQQINNNNNILNSYIGLKWYHSTTQKTFYSLIIQSPHSQRVIELISYNKPDLSLYPNLRKDFEWKRTNIPRASFKQYPEGEYPWTGYVGTLYQLGLPLKPDIVPIKISYACTDVEEQISFYTDVLEATLLESESNVIDTMDDVQVSYAFIQTVGSFIEIEYISRPVDYTYGEFTVETYSNLLKDTHNDRISGIYCGIDRWFDNHYGFDTSMFYDDDGGYMDRVFFKLITENVKYRLYYIDHQRDEAWIDSDSFDIDDEDLHGVEYKLFVFDANGQGIQMIGYFDDTYIERTPPIYNKQWCATPCPQNEAMGLFDFRKVYQDNVNDIVYQIIVGDRDPSAVRKKKSMRPGRGLLEKLLIIIVPVAVILSSTILYCLCGCPQRRVSDAEIQPLLPKQ